MRIAWITTPPSSASPVGAGVWQLLPHLREHAQVEIFVEAGREEGSGADSVRSVAQLRPKQHDQVLYSVGDEAEHGFMAPLLRRLGGTVWLHAWRLPALARAALERPDAGRA